jgi:hypothetical protein
MPWVSDGMDGLLGGERDAADGDEAVGEDIAELFLGGDDGDLAAGLAWAAGKIVSARRKEAEFIITSWPEAVS